MVSLSFYRWAKWAGLSERFSHLKMLIRVQRDLDTKVKQVKHLLLVSHRGYVQEQGIKSRKHMPEDGFESSTLEYQAA